jgi:hypothetical protein
MTNLMNKSSSFERTAWPRNAISRKDIEQLFSRMAALYGERFGAMWRGTNVQHVQLTWALELAKLTCDQLLAGSDNLAAILRPPTLPEFVALCRSARAEQLAASAPRLANEKRADQITVDANLGRIRKTQQQLQRKQPTAEWAFRLLMRAQSMNGAVLPAEVVRCARYAVTSSAGMKTIAGCSEPELRSEYQMILRTALGEFPAKTIV